ncbi:MAG TPA: MurR/RpiR family transcriptional regulator, partial [Rhodospirillales bacterium]|nr:MurR/RpiR family transcriptional regulator [Rhodospirillales bacterium]
MTQTTLAERIRSRLPELTKAERRVAHVLLGRYPLAGLETVQALARRAGVSTASVLRFTGKLGFPSYNAFQGELRAQLAATLQSPLTRYRAGDDVPAGGDAGLVRRHLAEIRGALVEAESLVVASEIEATVGLLADLRRPVYLLGGRYSGRIAGYMADLLRGVRPQVIHVDGQTQKWADHLLDIGRRSVLVCFDFRRYQADVLAFAEHAAKRGARVVLITDPWHSAIERVATHLLPVPVASPSIYD